MTEKVKHTPGELQIAEERLTDIVIRNDQHDPVALCYTSGWDKKTARANAKHLVKCWNEAPELAAKVAEFEARWFLEIKVNRAEVKELRENMEELEAENAKLGADQILENYWRGQWDLAQEKNKALAADDQRLQEQRTKARQDAKLWKFRVDEAVTMVGNLETEVERLREAMRESLEFIQYDPNDLPAHEYEAIRQGLIENIQAAIAPKEKK